ncbi:hypothetical protein Ctob_000430 [Chrysochromulina tobinii]|uniref:Ion transport domain-containing protein n=1 Tax=Chrysochromulina tobinii TaxID=1460289 RepID=A0A0M0J3W1_9EUKA|nr:hypothetical protein Ctob_000430 [Chrysochromulina tobinii]|eukprot:KOO20933.1 hypothetical protein Ctob_000430 [Chrysochromulina sp. CCMP291]
MFNPKLDCCVKISDEMLDEFPRIESSVLGAGKQLPLQEAVHDFYKHPVTAGAVALIIMANFVINIVEKEIDPDANDLQYPGLWYGADTFFNIIFIFELWANVWGYGGPVKEWITGWNIFDTIIVAVGVATMANVLGPPFDKLKLMRAFRVFRLFKRVKELNQIIVSILKSIPAVSYAFVVMFIFFAIYAILAVELFRGFGAGGSYETYDDVTDDTLVITSLTKRGYVYGMEYYGTFSRAMYTLFQVQSGESWSEAVARPLIFGLTSTGGGDDPIVLTYFYSFRILMKVVLLNVVVAVLLDSFGKGDGEDEDDDVVDEPTALSAAAMTTAPSPASPATALTASDEPQAVISAEAMTKLEKLLGKVDELGSLAKMVSEMQATVGLMKRERFYHQSKIFARLRHRDYFDVAALIESVSTGAVAAVRGSYVAACAADGQKLMCRQDIPHKRFWTAGELQGIYDGLKALVGAPEATRRFGKLFVSVSCRWLSTFEPDPNCFHLERVGAACRLYLENKCSASGLRALIFAPLGLDAVEFALFWDWASLYQPKPVRHAARSPKQKVLYLRGLEASKVWYGHAHTLIWMHTALPADAPAEMTTYEQSGWCYTEARASELLKPRINRLDLAKMPLPLTKLKTYDELAAKCVAKLAEMPERLHPPRVAAALRFTKRFTISTDLRIVTSYYTNVFRHVCLDSGLPDRELIDVPTQRASEDVDVRVAFEVCRICNEDDFYDDDAPLQPRVQPGLQPKRAPGLPNPKPNPKVCSQAMEVVPPLESLEVPLTLRDARTPESQR